MKSTDVEMISPEVVAYLLANPEILESLRREAFDVNTHNIEHEETDRKPSGNSDSDSENQVIPRYSLSSMSDSSTGIGNVNIGYDSFLDISCDKNNEGKVFVRIADERLKTWLGEQQGDHVISYEIFLRFCARKINGKSLRDIPHVLNAAFSAIMPNMANSSNYPSSPKLLDRDRVSKGYKRLTDDEIDDLNTGRRYKQVKAIEQYVFSLAECYTKMPEVSRLRTGSKGVKEGPEIRAAIASLNAINEFLTLKEDEHIDDHQRIEFAKRCLATKGDLVDGMRKLFNVTTIGDVRGSFVLPNNVKEDDPKFNSTLASAFFNAMCEKSNDYSLIAQLIEACFDFPYEQYPLIYKSTGKDIDIAASKRAGLQKQGIETLIIPSAQCLAFTLGAFDKIQITDTVISPFITAVITNQEWNAPQINKQNLKNLILEINDNFSRFLDTERSALSRYYESKEKTKAEISGGYAERITSERTKDSELTK